MLWAIIRHLAGLPAPAVEKPHEFTVDALATLKDVMRCVAVSRLVLHCLLSCATIT